VCYGAGVSYEGVGGAEGLLGVFEGTESGGGGVGFAEGMETGEGGWGGKWGGGDAECGETEEEVDVGGVLDLYHHLRGRS
jgi:hypothetical protein